MKLTKREHFAGLAMQGLISEEFKHDGHELKHAESIARKSIRCADAMIKALGIEEEINPEDLVGRTVEVISNTSCHGYNIGDKIVLTKYNDDEDNEDNCCFSSHKIKNSDGNWYITLNDIKY